MDTWIVVALAAWSGVAVLLALVLGRMVSRSEHEERVACAARGAQHGLVPVSVAVPTRAVEHHAQRSAS